MLRFYCVTGVFLLFILTRCTAQETLPKLSVKNINDKILVSWKVNWGARITAINIQRSADSLRNFTTIGSVLDPMNRENGFVDNKGKGDTLFYRVFVAFAGGRFIFTRSYRPVKDSSSGIPYNLQNYDQTEAPGMEGFVPSRYIYTSRESNVIIKLADAASSKYSAKFFDENDNPVFELREITEPYLIIEKVNFIHAGWFYFILYEHGILKEKNQFYISKEGKVGIPPNEVNKRF